MATKEYVPSLSEAGWVKDPIIALDKIMSYYFASDASQGNVYAGKVRSFPFVISKYGNKPNDLISSVESDLYDLLVGYYEEVVVEAVVGPIKGANVVSTDLENANDNLSIFVEVVDSSGVRTSLAKVLSIKDSSFKVLTTTNNYGQ